MGHLTSSLLKSTPLIIVLLLGFPAAISADDEPHDWSECTKIGEGLSIKSDIEEIPIPDPVPSSNLQSLQCNAAPEGEYNDVHCGNVNWVTHHFCDHYAGVVAELDEDVNDSFQDSGPEYVVEDKFPVHVGPVFYDPHDYIDHANTVSAYFDKKMDYFNVSITTVPDCMDDEVNLAEPEPGVTCHELLWGTWVGCNNNKGRAGEIQAGCLKYRLDSLY